MEFKQKALELIKGVSIMFIKLFVIAFVLAIIFWLVDGDDTVLTMFSYWTAN